MRKRGVSNLLITIFLILFAIFLSFLLFDWIRNPTENIMEGSVDTFGAYQSCEEVEYWISEAYCEEELLKIKIKNNKNIDFKNGFSIATFSEAGRSEITTFLYGTTLLPYEEKEIKALRQYEIKEGDRIYSLIDFVQVAPRIVSNGEFKLCQDKVQEIEVRNC